MAEYQRHSQAYCRICTSRFVEAAEVHNAGSSRQVRDAVNVYRDCCRIQWQFVKVEYRLWHHKWQAIDVADRPKTVLSALDHCTVYLTFRYCSSC